MYKYNEVDKKIIAHRVEEFKNQVKRRIKGRLTEEEFKPLRLMNGVYLQLHAYMLRIAIPYGELSSEQLKKISVIADKYDRGYGHFTTRQNIQLNWPKLIDIPKILDELSKVEMHAIQTSGNCIRNISSDHLAGLTKEEIEDPRPWCEIIRQWSTLHPEFSFLPRKFKIAITGCPNDRAAIKFHDIGLRLIRNLNKIGFEVYVGGGQGRTPVVAKKLSPFVEKKYILNYLESILRIYNRLGRRDNIYKARIKILVNQIGIKEFLKKVEEEFLILKKNNSILRRIEIQRIKNYFKLPKNLIGRSFSIPRESIGEYRTWLKKNCLNHKIRGFSIVNISLKTNNLPPGDIKSKQMKALADISKKFSYGEIRVTHEQNLILPHIKNKDLFILWKLLKKQDLATPNINSITDIICCPGLDYCALATARSIPISQRITDHFKTFEKQEIIGQMKVKISGCINACGHHHVGNIGILGLDRNGKEFYQITIGGSANENGSIGKIIGPSFSSDKIIEAIQVIINVYLKKRKNKKENFLKTLNKIGLGPFKTALYKNDNL